MSKPREMCPEIASTIRKYIINERSTTLDQHARLLDGHLTGIRMKLDYHIFL